MTEPRPEMKPLQALIVGAVAGSLMKTEGFIIDVEIPTDEQGYLPEIIVTGGNSGEVVRIKVEQE